MTSQPGLLAIEIHILANISQNKRQPGNEIWSIYRNIFLQNYAKNEAGRLVPDLFLFFEIT